MSTPFSALRTTHSPHPRLGDPGPRATLEPPPSDAGITVSSTPSRALAARDAQSNQGMS